MNCLIDVDNLVFICELFFEFKNSVLREISMEQFWKKWKDYGVFVLELFSFGEVCLYFNRIKKAHKL